MVRAAALLVSIAACVGGDPEPQRIVANQAAAVPIRSEQAPVLRAASSSPVIQISAAAMHTCALHADHTVSCWGSNRSGAIADHPSARPFEDMVYGAVLPAPVGAPLREVRVVAAGSDRTCVLRADGVWCWGMPTGAPEHIAGTASAVDLTTECARDAAGEVVCWGDLLVADREPALDGALDLVSVAGWTCAIKQTGAIACWGKPTVLISEYARTQVEAKTEKTVAGGVQLAMSDRQACIRLAAGGVSCWSREPYHDEDAEPRRVAGIEHAVDLAVTMSFGCALDRDGAVTCWGAVPGRYGEAAARTVPGLRADELVAGHAFVCARTGGEVRCWGDNHFGQLGIGWSAIHPAPIAVPGIDDAVDVHTGAAHTCVRHRDTTVSCWGRMGYEGPSGPKPRAVPAATGAIELGGSSDLCIRLGSGEIRCGDERGLRRSATDAIAFSRSASHGTAIKRDGTVMSWGQDYYGQFGTGTTHSFDAGRGTAKKLRDPVAIEATESMTCAVRRDGRIACLGRLTHADNVSVPLEPAVVPGIDHAISLALGDRSGCALIDDGTVRCWGMGLLAVRPPRVLPDPTRALPVEGLTDVVQLSGTRTAMCAVRRDRTLACWGLNLSGALGDPSAIDWSTTPIEMPVTDVVDVSAGDHVCAVQGSGRVLCWGLAQAGQLGTLESGQLTSPEMPVVFPPDPETPPTPSPSPPPTPSQRR